MSEAILVGDIRGMELAGMLTPELFHCVLWTELSIGQFAAVGAQEDP